MTHFRVFLGAPSISDLKKDPRSYTWKTIEPPSAEVSQALVYPPATLEAASRRISLFYQNIIFDDSDEEVFDQEGVGQEARPEGSEPITKGVSVYSFPNCMLDLHLHNRADDGDNLASNRRCQCHRCTLLLAHISVAVTVSACCYI